MKFIQKYAKRINRLLTGILCLILWQGCFKFRTSDPDAITRFKTKNIEPRIGDFYYGDSKKLHYVETGDSAAPTIFFIHGTPGSWNNFEGFLADSTLVSLYRMISIDRPGFGYSNFGHAEDIDNQVDEISRFVRSKNNHRPVIIVGHSLGGPIVVAMAGKDTTIANTIILLAASVSPELEPSEKYRKPLALPIIRLLAPGAMRPANDEMIDFKTYVKAMPSFLQNIRCTTYVIHGTKDMLVPYGNAAFAEKNLTHDASTNMITLEGENHFIPWTRFEDLRALLIYIYKDLK